MAGVIQRATQRTHTPQRQHREQVWSGLDSSPSILLHSQSSSSNKKKKKSSIPGGDESRGVIRAIWERQELEAELGHEDGDYVRPKIREDLLPHDFSKWWSTPNGSILPATASSPGWGGRSSNVGGRAAPGQEQRAFFRPRLSQGSDSFLGGGGDGEKLVGHSREFTGAGSPVMEDWSGLVGGGGVGGGSGIDRTIYQNLVEMLPLMESFMEQKGVNRRPFTRHASMVYTPAPSRDTPLKKVGESPLKSKKNKQQRPANGNTKPADGTPQWDEQENMLRRIEKDDCVQQQQHSEAEAMIERLSREELTELQNQIDGLKQQLWEKDNMLQTVRSYEMAENAKQEQILELKARLDEFHTALRDKDRITEMIQTQLTEKKRQLGSLESVLERTQLEMIRKNDTAARMQEELRQLRVQASQFQFQTELQNGRILEEQEGDEDAAFDDDNYAEISAELQMPAEESESLEAARRMYLGAVIAAKNKPGDESMALAAESRKMLQTFLSHPYLRGDSLGLPLC